MRKVGKRCTKMTMIMGKRWTSGTISSLALMMRMLDKISCAEKKSYLSNKWVSLHLQTIRALDPRCKSHRNLSNKSFSISRRMTMVKMMTRSPTTLRTRLRLASS